MIAGPFCFGRFDLSALLGQRWGRGGDHADPSAPTPSHFTYSVHPAVVFGR